MKIIKSIVSDENFHSLMPENLLYNSILLRTFSSLFLFVKVNIIEKMHYSTL